MVDFNDDSAVTNFRDSQLAGFGKLAGEAWCVSQTWYRETNPSTASATGHVNAALFAALIQILQLVDQRWASQFIHCFPLTGYICQSGVFPLQNEPLAELLEHRHFLITRHNDSNNGLGVRFRPTNNTCGTKRLRNRDGAGSTHHGA